MVQKTAITRRKFLQFTAAFSALPLIGCAQEKTLIEWDGIALGADSNIQIFHPDKEKAKQILRDSLSRVTELEKMFSLYRDDSLIVELNKTGKLKNPPREFVELIKKSKYFGDVTNGQFDITVQPLWHKTGGVELINYQDINVSNEEISFDKSGMQITLNGIAQGFITDEIAKLMRANGIENALISLGEKYAIGNHPNGRNWRVGIADSEQVIELKNQAIATSSNKDTRHIFNPKTGETDSIKSVTVIAENATKADALSTALCLGYIDGIEESENIRIL